jgi:hypothetical protein
MTRLPRRGGGASFHWTSLSVAPVAPHGRGKLFRTAIRGNVHHFSAPPAFDLIRYVHHLSAMPALRLALDLVFGPAGELAAHQAHLGADQRIRPLDQQPRHWRQVRRVHWHGRSAWLGDASRGAGRCVYPANPGRDCSGNP